MNKKNRFTNFSANYFLIVLFAVGFSFAFAYLEYNYMLFDMIPYREAKAPLLANLYSYDLLVFIPTLTLLSFYPLIYQIFESRSLTTPRRLLAIGGASLLLGLIIKDAGWHLLRAIAPISSDPLAHQWIRPSDPTASIIGFADIFGLRIPLWYLALSPIIIAVFVSIIITKTQPQQNNQSS